MTSGRSGGKRRAEESIGRGLLCLLVVFAIGASEPREIVLDPESTVELYEHPWTKTGFQIPPDDKSRVTFHESFDPHEVAALAALAEREGVFSGAKSWAACFQPRHSLVVTAPGSARRVIRICFACGNYAVDGGPALALGQPGKLREHFAELGVPFVVDRAAEPFE